MIEAQCPECRYRIRAKDALAGKLVLCPDCNAKVRIPEADNGFEVIEDSPPVRKAAPAAKPRQAAMLPPPPPRPAVRPRAHDDDDDRPRKKVRRRRRDSEDTPVHLYVMGGGAVILLLLALIGFKSSGIATLNILIGWLMTAVAGIWVLVIAFQEEAICGVLCIVVPFYSLYYVITRWDDCKLPVALEVCGFVMLFLGAAAIPDNGNNDNPFGLNIIPGHQINVV